MRKWMTLFLVWALFVTGCGGSDAGLQVTSTLTVEPPPPPPPPQVRLVFVGDVMLTRLPGDAVARGEDPFASFADVFGQADLAVGNLECVIATVGKAVPKAWNFRCHPRNVPLLARHLDAVSVANNHSGDYGKDAFAEQLSLLKKGGVPYFGGGLDSREARSPLILERNGIKVAYLAFNEVEYRSYEAGPNKPGLAWGVDENLVADVAAAKAKADLVIVYPHWGIEYQKYPSERQKSLARKLVDAGADLVVGAHPHVIETQEYYKGKLIVYSLGNFIFDDFNDVPPGIQEPSRLSHVLRVTMTRDGLVQWDTLLARTDDDGIPRKVAGAQTPCGRAGTAEIGLCKSE